MRRLTLLALCILTVCRVQAQTMQMKVSKVDSAGLFLYTAANYSYMFTLADLQKESANLMGVGVDLGLKLQSNWSFETGFNYYFSGKVKGTDTLFRFITNQSGNIMDGDGTPADIDVDQRGWSLRIAVGKVFPISPNYRNAGIQVKLGGDLLQRYIFIKNPDNKVAALTDEYKKGYDRLTLGFGAYQFIGYFHVAKHKYASFYFGVEASETFGHRQRKWDFSGMGRDTRPYTDVMVGLKMGWIVSLYKKEYQDTFYFR